MKCAPTQFDGGDTRETIDIIPTSKLSTSNNKENEGAGGASNTHRSIADVVPMTIDTTMTSAPTKLKTIGEAKSKPSVYNDEENDNNCSEVEV